MKYGNVAPGHDLVAHLLDLIEREGLKPGERLPSVEHLAGRLVVSRLAIREAIATLKAQGRLATRPGGGVSVLAASQTVAPSQPVEDLLNWMEFRTSVEVEAAGWAAERRTEHHLFLMERSLRRFERNAALGEPTGQDDREFHQAIAAATGNEQFANFLAEHGKRLIPPTSYGAAMVSGESRKRFLLEGTLVEHRRILEAIVARDAGGSREAMRRHQQKTPGDYREWLALNQTSPRGSMSHDVEE